MFRDSHEEWNHLLSAPARYQVQWQVKWNFQGVIEIFMRSSICSRPKAENSRPADLLLSRELHRIFLPTVAPNVDWYHQENRRLTPNKHRLETPKRATFPRVCREIPLQWWSLMFSYFQPSSWWNSKIAVQRDRRRDALLEERVDV